MKILYFSLYLYNHLCECRDNLYKGVKFYSELQILLQIMHKYGTNNNTEMTNQSSPCCYEVEKQRISIVLGGV